MTNLEASFREGRPGALVQMAAGSGKTFTAISSIYRLVKESGARRVLFLVDRGNLGRQALKELQAYTHTHAVRDRVNLPFQVYEIRTRVTEGGAMVVAAPDTVIGKRDRAYAAQYGKGAPRLADGKLHEWITVFTQLRALSPNVEKFGRALRDSRNYVHPAEQLAHGFSPDGHTARISFHVVQTAAEDLVRFCEGDRPMTARCDAMYADQMALGARKQRAGRASAKRRPSPQAHGRRAQIAETASRLSLRTMEGCS